ncbi:MAG: hypothetical protein HYT83_00760 [Candidatus Levybacteria bacterium]|nr:hypothetical protein [Candidatus Levybacteria bacterium]
MRDFFHHLFVPRESNNHRAKILHHQSILIVIIFLLVGQLFINIAKTNFSSVLGTTIDISSQELLIITNQKRQSEGFTSLTLNDQLSQAAALKAKDMFTKNYWAHTSPDGTSPWTFFKKVGYDYTYAGENLARGFTSSGSIVDAWMASTSHRENVLSKNYQEVGFAIVQGKLMGEDTTLIVEMFGGKNLSPLAAKPENSLQPVVPSVISLESALGQQSIAAVSAQSLISVNSLTKNLSTLILVIFIVTLLSDMIIIERKKISRLVGHNMDHLAFLGAILLFVILFSTRVILQ